MGTASSAPADESACPAETEEVSACPAETHADEAPEVQATRISAGISRARNALEEVKAKVAEYDAQYKASETASAHLGGVISKAQEVFDSLETTASLLKDRTVEIPTKAL